MGYTHYWRQARSISVAAFATIGDDVAAILAEAVERHCVAICNGEGAPGSSFKRTPDLIAFNGTERRDLAHEGMVVERRRRQEAWQSRDQIGLGFCKTARKPYDVAVTAVLCYLATVAGTHAVSSDGRGRDWVAGLALARAALPRHANLLDIPPAILRADRWCAPYPGMFSDRYRVRFCIDGHAYVLEGEAEHARYRFTDHREAAIWLLAREDPDRPGQPLFDARGVIDATRRRRLGAAQDRALDELVASAATSPPALNRRAAPPTSVRPDETPEEPVRVELQDLAETVAAS